MSEGRSIALESIAKDSGLSTTTVRRFCVTPDAVVTASQLAAAAKLVLYFGVPLGALVIVTTDAPASAMRDRLPRNGTNGRGAAGGQGRR